MADRRLTYTIGINADTASFMQQIQSAVNALQKLGTKTNLTKELQESSLAALELANNLQKATNPSTGKFDILTFQQQLDRSGKKIEDYYTSLSQLGDKGKQAFLNTAQAIAQAEQPLVRTNKLMSQLWTTMQNTVRWQITTGVLNTFTGAINTAFGYSKDLDSSLNSIRIVTGKSAEEMSRFAKQANEAAKALNTTTTDYTDASLIYFQQGLDEEQVKARTDATIKMANVSGQTAEEVSEQMTAIWNNFDDGSKKLEYYGDVLVALGASTASSSDEITEGVQKFAAVADTVGLSYEYAAAALATLTANTRESADVVGNALKTLFARIQGLQLGETLDDGTDLNKYSEALASVGVNVKGVNGELKGMDQILTETAAKWEILSKDQQVALAQTVAGVRQYNQFVSLMDNWPDFEKNLDTAYNAGGALAEQAEIYAESWKAARDKVRASAEDIYDSLVNPDFYIDVNNMVSPLLNRIADIIDGLGGMQGILGGLALTMNRVYGGQIAASMEQFIVNLGIINKTELKRTNDLRNQIATIMELNSKEMEQNGIEQKYLQLRQEVLSQSLRLQGQVSAYMDQLTPRQQGILQQKMEEIQLVEHQISSYVDLYQKQNDYAEKYSKDMQEQFYQAEEQIRATDEWQDAVERVSDTINQRFKNRGITFRINLNTQEVLQTYQQMVETLDAMARKSSGLNYIKEQMKQLSKEGKTATQDLLDLAKELQLIDQSAKLGTSSTDKFFNEIQQDRGAVSDMNLSLSEFRQTLSNTFNVSMNNSDKFVNATRTADAALRAEGESAKIASDKIKEVNQAMEDGSLKAKNWAENLVDVGSQISALTMALNSIDAAFDTIGDLATDKEDFSLDTFTRLLSSLGGIGYAFSGISKGVKEAGSALSTVGKILGGAGTAAGVASGKFATVATAITGVASAAAPYIAIGGIIIGVILGICDVLEKEKQAHIEELEASQEARHEAMEQRDANEELLVSYQELLQVYEETGEGKSELDSKSQELANAYGVEGSALARLSGEQANYNRLLREAKEIRDQELKEQRDDAKANLEDAGEVLELSGALRGFDLGSLTNNKGTAILEKYIPGMSSGDIGQWNTYDTDLAHIGEFYDNLTKARQEMEEKLTDKEKEKFEVYEQVVGYLDEYGEKIQTYRDSLSEYMEDQAQLGELAGQIINEDDISNYQEFKDWIDQITSAFEAAGMTSEEVEESIDNIVKTSLNPKVRELNDVAEALAQVKDLVTDPRLDLEYIFSSDKYDPAILATLKWETITVESFGEAYRSAERYQGAIKDVEEATKTLSNLEEAQKIMNKAKGDMSIEDWQKVAGAIDWGNQEQGIIEFTEFLRMTAIEQQEYLQSLTLGAYQTLASGIDTQIEEKQAELERLQDRYENINAQMVDQANATVTALDNLMKAKEDYDAYSSDIFENFNLEDYKLDAELLANVLGDTVATTFEGKKIFDWKKIVAMSQDELQEAIDKAGKDARATVKLEADTRGDMEEVQGQLDSLKLTKEIDLEVNFNKQLSSIESYTDDIVGVFDALENGVKRTTDSAGNEIYSFTIEAAKAIEDMYPGFIAAIEKNNGALRDGTYALTQDMYNAFFDSVNGQVAIDAKGKMQMIQNDITMLEGKKARLEQALELAKKIASGEVSIYSLSEEQKELLLEAYVTAEKITNGELLSEESQVLKDIDEGYKTVWEQVSDYSSQAAQNMADAMGDATDIMLQDAVQIRDALQSIRDGTESGVFRSFDTKAARGTVGKGKVVTDQGATSFIESLLAKANEDVTPYDLDDNSAYKQSKEYIEKRKQLSMAAGAEAEKALQAGVDNVNSAIAVLSVTGQKMLAGVDDFANKLSKESKKSGGSKKSSAEAQKYYVEELEKELEEIQDRYHEITREIQKQDDLLEDIGNNVERSYGVQKLKNYQRELKALQKQQENYNAKLKEATETWLPRDTQRLKQLFGEDAIQIKSNGEIANYSNLEQKIIDDYNNNFLKPYNEFMKKYTETTDKDAKNKLEALKAEWETKKKLADKEFEDRKEALSQYEKTRDVIQEQTDALEENARLIQDNKLSQIEYKLEIILDVKSMKDALREFDKQAQEIFGDALTSGTGGMNRLGLTDRQLNIGELTKEQAEAEANLYQSYAAQFRDLKALFEEANDQTDRDRIIQDIMELQGKVLDSAEAIVEWVNSIEDIIPDALAAAAERYAIFTDQLEHNTTVLDSIKELYALQGVTYKTAEGFKRLQDTSREKLETQVAEAQLQKKWMEEARSNLEMAQAQLDSLNGDEGDIRYDTFKKARDAYLQEFNEATEATLAKAKEAMETAKDMYLEQIDRAAYEFGQKVSNGLGLDLLQDQYDHRIEENERYFDPVNEAYETLTWYNKLQADIDKSKNPVMTEQLKALQKEIDLRRENGTLNQHDLDVLNAKYEVLKAQAALEDAQNAKNEVKLVRDRQGNWNYQYVANQQEVEDKNQDLLDATNEWYNIELDYVKDINDEILQTYIDCQEEIEALKELGIEDDELFAQKRLEIENYYKNKRIYLEQEKQNTIKGLNEAGNASLIIGAKVAGETLTDQAQVTADQMVAIQNTSWEDILGLVTDGTNKMEELMNENASFVDIFDNSFAENLDNMTGNAETFQDALDEALNECQNSFEEYGDTVQEVAEDTGTTYEELADMTDEVSESTDMLTDSGLDAADTLWELIDAADEAARSYADMAEEIWGTVDALRELAQQQVDYVEDQVGADSYDDIKVPGDVDDWSAHMFDKLEQDKNYLNSQQYKEDMASRAKKLLGMGNTTALPNDKLAAIYEGYVAGNPDILKRLEKYRSGQNFQTAFAGFAFDTGGYTGEFEGARLAFLHQKELVLNAKDTENILTAVDAIRQIDFQAIERMLDSNVGNMFSTLVSRIAIPNIAPIAGATENNYHIDRVEFPNITSADGIEEAFESLPDEAAQWSQIRKS